MFIGTLKIGFFIYISSRRLKPFIALGLINSYNLLSFKFRNFKFDLNNNFANNYKKSNARRFLHS